MKEDIRDFVEAHRRMQATPHKLPTCLEEVWKKLQRFSMEDTLSFYELAATVQAMHTFPSAHKVDDGPPSARVAQLVPAEPWRSAIVSQGFASFEEPGKFTVHDLVYSLFSEYIFPPKVKPAPPAPLAPPVRVTPTATRFRLKTKGKKNRGKK